MLVASKREEVVEKEGRTVPLGWVVPVKLVGSGERV
jgi:hypothetical protein